MKYATKDRILELKPILDELRQLPLLLERKPGTFRKGARAFLHFHEDAAGVYADLKVDGEWKRMRIVSDDERAKFLREALSAGSKS